jgi:hypothetical protein
MSTADNRHHNDHTAHGAASHRTSSSQLNHEGQNRRHNEHSTGPSRSREASDDDERSRFRGEADDEDDEDDEAPTLSDPGRMTARKGKGSEEKKLVPKTDRKRHTVRAVSIVVVFCSLRLCASNTF